MDLGQKIVQTNPFSSQSEPIQFVFTWRRPIQALQYIWDRRLKFRAYPNVDIQRDFLYYFYAFSFSADISVLDYQGAIDITPLAGAGNFPDASIFPLFHLYLEGDAGAPILRQPLALPTYYSDIDFRKWKAPRTTSDAGSGSNTMHNSLTGEQVNHLKASFEATLTQTPNLIGKQYINLILTLFAQEITSDSQKELLLGNRGKK